MSAISKTYYILYCFYIADSLFFRLSHCTITSYHILGTLLSFTFSSFIFSEDLAWLLCLQILSSNLNLYFILLIVSSTFFIALFITPFITLYSKDECNIGMHNTCGQRQP